MELDRIRSDTGLAVVEVEEPNPRNLCAATELHEGTRRGHLSTPKRSRSDVRLDLGPRGEREAQMEPGDYSKNDLVGRLLVVTIDDAAIVAAARSHARGPILIQPDRDVEPGTIVN